MRIELFKAIDWFLDNPVETVDGFTYDQAKALERSSIAFSAFDAEGCVGCGGFMFWSENEAEAWIRLDVRGLSKSQTIIRAMKESFDIGRNVYNDDIFCWVDESWPVARRFAGWIGFVPTNKTKKIDNKLYRLWEIKNGTSNNGDRVGSICDGTDTTGQYDASAGRSPSTNS